MAADEPVAVGQTPDGASGGVGLVVDLAILGAGKVIEKNLDDATNRKLVDEFLSGLKPMTGRR